MLHKLKILSITCSALCLSACMLDGTNSTPNYYSQNRNEPTSLYPEGYESMNNDRPEPKPTETANGVVVPETYHVGSSISPTSSKNSDRNWVSSQNPQGYTIKIAKGDKAATVANALYQAPKTEHAAEIQARNGSYEGLYGTYATYEDAQQKLNTLPGSLKQGAEIQTWSSVQSNLGD